MISEIKKQNTSAQDVSYWNNAIVHWVVIATIFINIGVVILFMFYVKPSDVALKLQYNVFFGTSLHAPWWHVYFLPAMSISFFLIDLIIGYMLYTTKERIAAYVVILGALFAAVALLIAALSIVFNNYTL